MKPPYQLQKGVVQVRLTGSRAFGVASRNSDWDWFAVLLPPRINKELRGWSRSKYQIDDGYIVFKYANQNLIVAMSVDAVLRWKKAERHCMIERPRDKSRRKAIFGHYLYDMPLTSKQLSKVARRMWRERTLDKLT